MEKILFFLILSASLLSCKKSSENIVWEKSYGSGKSVFVKSAGDTGYVSCGEAGGKQYLLLVDKNGNKVFEYLPENYGILTSAWLGDGFIVTAGSTGRQMEISKIDLDGTVLWDSVFNTTFPVEHTSLCWLGGENFLAIGSADPDSSIKTVSGLSFIWFDNGGTISNRMDSTYLSYIAVRSAVTDNSGNLYLALTRKGTSGKMKAMVTKYNIDIQKIWETELYNNPSYNAASISIVLDQNNNPVVSGRTEVAATEGTADNSFVARYFFTGDSVQKQYLEYINSGTSVTGDGAGQFMVLNMKCLIINIMDQNMKISGIIRTFNSCDSKTTDVFGYSMDLSGDGNIIIAGSKDNGYYLAVKSSSALSPA